MKKRFSFLNELVKYFSQKGLKSNAETIKFFKRATEFEDRLSIGDFSLEGILKAFLKSNSNNMSNCSEWVHPIILKLIKNYYIDFSIGKDPVAKKFMAGFTHLFEKGQISLDDRIQFFIEFAEWSNLTTPFLMSYQENKDLLIVIHKVLLSILNELECQEHEISF